MHMFQVHNNMASSLFSFMHVGYIQTLVLCFCSGINFIDNKTVLPVIIYNFIYLNK